MDSFFSSLLSPSGTAYSSTQLNSVKWIITNQSESKTYGIADSLTAGTYSVTAKYSSYSVTTSFTVSASNPIVASEGKGYKTASLSQYRVDQSNGLGVMGPGTLQSIGTPKILVVPVYFSNVTAPTSSQLSIIEKSYFGSKEETGWESLASYYEASSYGKLHITGTVTTPFKYGMTTSSFENSADGKEDEACQTLIKAIKSNLTSSGYNLSDYDNDDDGYIDGLEMVYFTDKSIGGKDIWWAFTSTMGLNAGTVRSPNFSYYFWSPYSMTQDGYYTPDIDAHTLTHESGHMMGLDDYYSYNSSDDGAPAGCADMMDCNIGDHNGYSKMALGWVDPKVIDGSSSDFTINLSPFEDTGDCIILRDTKTDPWNGYQFDEYLLLQYYTPTGLNEADSKGYPEWGDYKYGGTYASEGLQVFHIDARMFEEYGVYSTSGTFMPKGNRYTDELKTDDVLDSAAKTYVSYSMIAASNTNSYSMNVGTGKYGSKNRLVSIIPANKTTAFKSSSNDTQLNEMGNPKCLFTASGTSFYSQYSYKGFFPNATTFNDGSSLNYNFSVVSNDADGCQIHFVETN